MAIKIRHSIEISEEGGVRFLHFGSEWVQGAMRIARPFALELEYTREMMGCLLLRGAENSFENSGANWPRRVLQIGMGAASLAKFWYRYFPHAMQTIVEINPAVVTMAYQSFKLPRDEARITVHIADGVAWMKDVETHANASPTDKFDCIMVDGYDHNARFGALGSEDFYRDCRARLSRRGLLVLNLFGRTHGYKNQADNLRVAFDNRVLALPPVEGGNAIVFAAVGEAISLDSSGLKIDAAKIAGATGLKLAATITRIEQAAMAVADDHFRHDKNASRKRQKNKHRSADSGNFG